VRDCEEEVEEERKKERKWKREREKEREIRQEKRNLKGERLRESWWFWRLSLGSQCASMTPCVL
jgi:hypothetical protein